MANFFDQFDPPEASSGGNFFDQFDEPAASKADGGNFFDRFDTVPDVQLPKPREDFLKRVPGLGNGAPRNPALAPGQPDDTPIADRKIINGREYRLGKDSGIVFDDKNQPVDDPVIQQAFGIVPQQGMLDRWVLNPLGRGKNQSLDPAYDVGMFLSGQSTPEDFAKGIVSNYEQSKAYPQDPRDAASMAEYQKANGFLESIGVLARNPNIIGQTSVESLPAMGAMAAGSLAGGLAGSAAGSVVPVVGTAAGGLAGSIAGTGMASGYVEFSNSLTQALAETGKPVTPENVLAAINDPEIMAAAKDKALKRGVSIGVFDALSAGIAGRIGKPVEKLVGGTAGRVAGAGTEVVGQGLAGAGGEAAGQIASEGQITRPGDVVLEGAAELATGPIEIGSAILGREAPNAVLPGQQPATPPATRQEPRLFPGPQPGPQTAGPGAPGAPPPAAAQPVPTNPTVTATPSDDILAADGYSPAQIADMTPDERRAALESAVARGVTPAAPAPTAPPAAETPPSASAGPAQAPPAPGTAPMAPRMRPTPAAPIAPTGPAIQHPPGPAIWANLSHDEPVTILDEPAQPGNDGKYYQPVTDMNGNRGYLAEDELRPQAPTPSSTPQAAQPSQGPGSELPNGFRAGPRGNTKYRVTPNHKTLGGKVLYEKRSETGQASSFYVGNDGNMVDADTVNVRGNDRDRLWTPNSEEARSKVAELLDRRGQIELNSPEDVALKDQIRQIVLEDQSGPGAPRKSAPADDLDALLNDAIAQEFGGQQQAEAPDPAPVDPAVVNRQLDDYITNSRKPLTQEAFAKHAGIDVNEAGKALQRAHAANWIYLGPKGYRRHPTRVAPLDVLEFVAAKGGVSDPTGELKALDLHKPKYNSPSYGPVVRRTGMHPDKMREALIDAGYIRDAGRDAGGQLTSTVADFYDVMGRAAGGEKIYAEMDQAKAAGLEAERKNRDLKPTDWEDRHPIETRYGPEVWAAMQQFLAETGSHEDAWATSEINDAARMIADGVDPEDAFTRAADTRILDLLDPDNDFAPEITAAFQSNAANARVAFEPPPFDLETPTNAEQQGPYAPGDGVRTAGEDVQDGEGQAALSGPAAQVRDTGAGSAEAGSAGADARQNFAGEFDGVSNDDFIANIEARIAAGENDVYIAPTADGPEFRTALEARGWKMGKFGRKGKAFYSPARDGYLFYDAAVAGNRLNVQFSPLKEKDMADYPDFVTGKESSPAAEPPKSKQKKSNVAASANENGVLDDSSPVQSIKEKAGSAKFSINVIQDADGKYSTSYDYDLQGQSGGTSPAFAAADRLHDTPESAIAAAASRILRQFEYDFRNPDLPDPKKRDVKKIIAKLKELGGKSGEAVEETPIPTTEPGAEGKPQLVIPGAEQDRKGALRNAANAPMRASTYQKPMDEGLFGSERDQTDMFDAPKPKEKVEPQTSIDDALESAMAEEFGTKPAPKKVGLQGNWWEPLMGGEEKPAKKPKTAGQAAKSAAKNTLKGMDEVAKGLQALFGDKNKLSSGFTFDENTYRQALPYFKAGAAHLKEAAKDMKELALALVRALKANGMTMDAVQAMTPYLKRFMEDVRDGRETLEADTPESESPFHPIVVAFVDYLTQPDAAFDTITEARKFAAERGFKAEPGTPAAKELDEMLEQAIVLTARTIVGASKKRPVQTAYRRLVDLYNRQPNLGVRTSESMADQAYSTPAPLAYIASRLAGVAGAKSVLEPTAGNGMLLIEAKPGAATVNEINDRRAAALSAQGFRVTQLDAATEKLRHAGYPVDSVIENPPFGAVRQSDGSSKEFDVDGWKTTQIDHAIALNTLKNMADDGRAVLIVGSVKEGADKSRSDSYNTKQKREFYWRLYQGYNVTDHFTVAGDLYKRQGAGWPVDVIVIEGRGKSARSLPAVDLPKVYDTWESLEEKLDEAPVQSQARPGQEAGGTTVSGPAVQRDGAQDAAGLETGGTGNRPAADVGRPSPGSATPAGQEPVSDGSSQREPARLGEQQPAKSDGSEVPSGERDLGDGDRKPAAPPRERLKQEAGTAQQTYKPMSGLKPLDTKIPTNMADAVEQSLGDLADRYGAIDQWIEKELGYKKGELGKYLAAEQVDAVAMALDNVKKNAAFIIGDQTGIGKGRVVASALRYAMRNGLVPIFVTEKPNLYGDIIRDLNDIGVPQMLGRELKPFLTNQGAAIPLDDEAVQWFDEAERAKVEGKPVPPKRGKFLRSSGGDLHKRQMAALQKDGTGKDFDIVFTTYDQMNTVKGATTDRRRLVDGLADRAFIVLDESHNAGGTEASERGSKKGDDSRSDFLKKVTGKAKAVMFSSATYAKRPGVMALYARTDMGKAVEKPEMLGELISRGGVPMQQIVASMLAKAGQYIRRERSFDGVSYDVVPVAVDTKAYEAVSKSLSAIARFDIELKKSDVWDEIKENLKKDAEAAAMDSGTGGASVNSTNFTSLMHNIVNQMLLAIKTDAVATRAIDALKAGEKPVITVANTMGAFLKTYAEENDVKRGDPVNLSFRDVLTRYLERTRRLTIKRPDGTTYHYTIPLTALPGYMQKAYREAEALIGAIDTTNLPISPIDWLRHRLAKAGYRVSEITGRKDILEYGGPDNATFSQRLDSEVSPAGRRVNIDKFNRGDIDVMILNRAGSTGLSLHASSKFKDQRRRRMIIAQAELNIDVHMQMLGRVHRTGQVIPPAFVQAYADVPAEARPAAVLAKKMASLNANTTASRKSAFSADDSVDFLNEYGDQVAREFLKENPEMAEDLDVGMDPEDETARELTGKLLLLPVSEQKRALDEITARYKVLIENLDAMGENALEAKTIDLGARTISRQELKSSEGDSPFTQAVILEEVEVKSQGKALPIKEILDTAIQKLGAGTVATDNPEVALDTLNRLAKRDRPLRFSKWFDDFDRMVADDIKATKTDDVREQRRAAYGENRRRFNEIVDLVMPGYRVDVRAKDGATLTGIVMNVYRRGETGKTGNPLALGAWAAEIAIPDNAQRISVPFSSMALPGDNVKEGERKVFISAPDWANGIKQTLDAFEKARQTGKESRYIVTGNILGGYDQTRGSGQIVNYTDDQGNVKPGILMSRTFSPKEFLDSRAVRFKTASQVMQFLKRLPNAEIVSHDGVITVRQQDARTEIELPASRQTGGTYFLNPDVRKAAADRFTKVGSRMRYQTNLPESAARVLDEMMKAGAVFQTTEQQDVAEEIVTGKKPTPAKPVGLQSVSQYGDSYAFKSTNEFRPDGRQLGDAAKEFVVANGVLTGNEYLVAIDANGRVIAEGHGNDNNSVGMSPELYKALLDPAQELIVHHNHPESTSLSPRDISMLILPGMGATWAHGHNGSSVRGALMPELRALIKDMPFYQANQRIEEAVKGARANSLDYLRRNIEAGKITKDQADQELQHLTNLVLHRAGVIDYNILGYDQSPLQRLPLINARIDIWAAALRTELEGKLNGKLRPDLRNVRYAPNLREHVADIGTGTREGQGLAGLGGQQAVGLEGSRGRNRLEEGASQVLDGSLFRRRLEPSLAPEDRINPYRFILTPRQSGKLVAEISDIATRILGHSVTQLNITPTREAWDDAFPNSDAVFDPSTAIIYVSLQSEKDPRYALRHEAIHALRQAGVFTAHEWAILSKMAQSRWIDQHNIRERYAHYRERFSNLRPDELEQLFIEEAVAEAMSDHANPMAAAREDVVSRIFKKVFAFLEAVRNMLARNGYRTADQILASVESGELGTRQRGSGQGRGFGLSDSTQSVSGFSEDRRGRQGLLQNVPADDGGHVGSLFGGPTTLEEDRVLEDFAGNINLTKIDGPESLKDVLREASDQADGFIGARRGVVSHDQTRMLAEQMGMTVRQLLSRRKGQAFNAHEAFAARAMLVKSGELVKEAAARLKRTRSDVDRARFARLMARHAAIQEQVAGMTAEAGRALNQFKMMAGPDSLRSAMEALNERSIDGRVGANNIDDLAHMVDSMDQPAQVATISRDMYRPNFWDMVREYYINSLLSGPSTQTVNFMSNMLTALNQIPESFLAEQIGKFHGGQKVERGESFARAVGLLEGSREGLQLAWKTLKTGEPHTPETQFDQQTQKAIPGIAGEIIRAPSRVMMSADDLFKAVNYRAELNALAVRKAMASGLRGQALAQAIQDLRNNPTDDMVAKAHANAKYQTFQTKLGKKGQALMHFRESWHLWWLFPFLRTPINIMKYAYERTPMGVMPVIGMRDARDRISGKNGSAARDIQIARVSIGTMVMLGLASMALQGVLTGGGPDDEKEKAVLRATGWQPYSIKIGDTYYSYQRFDPFSLHTGVVADMVELSKKMERGDYTQAAWMALTSVISNVTKKTWLKSATSFSEMTHNPRQFLEGYAGDLLSGFVPNFAAQVARALDPSFRDTQYPSDGWKELGNRFKERIPGQKETLPQKFDLFGQPIIGEGNFGPDLVSPVYMSKQKDNPVAKALLDAGYFPGMPRRHINGHDLTPEQYAEYTEAAGKEAVRRLSRIVQAENWSKRSQDQQERVLKQGFDQARELVRNRLMAKYPELRKKAAATP